MSEIQISPENVHCAAVGDEVTRRFGQKTRDAMASIGVRFGD